MIRRLISWIFVIVSKIRMFLYEKGLFKKIQLPIRVVSVGNIGVGGAGKTPLVIRLVNYSLEKGLKPAFIERGYKSELDNNTILCFQKGTDDIKELNLVGDEAMMAWEAINKGARLCVSKNKSKGAQESFLRYPDTNIIFVDDGFQHLALKRDLDIVLMDATKGFSDKVIPMGYLRELYSSLKRASVLIFTKSDGMEQKEKDALILKARDYNQNIKIFFAKTKFYSSQDLNNKKVLPVSAVFNASHFRKMLKINGAVFEKYIEYKDHKNFSIKDIEHIISFKKATGSDFIAVTKKDWVKLKDLVPKDDIIVCCYEHLIESEEEFLLCCTGS